MYCKYLRDVAIPIQGQDTVTLVDYHARPAFGLSIIAAPEDTLQAVAQVKSESYMPSMPQADGDGTMDFWTEAYAGSVLYAHVITRNTTLKGSG